MADVAGKPGWRGREQGEQVLVQTMTVNDPNR